MYYITGPDDRPDGYVHLSESRQWIPWLANNIPPRLDPDVRTRLNSNLKHLLVGLELKAALISGHRHQEPGQRNVLFEPYYQNLILEFCVAAFSVIEGLGAAHWLAAEGADGRDGPRVRRDQWKPALSLVYDPDRVRGLDGAIDRILDVRDRLHQDRLGARGEIDWHAMSYERAFRPAASAIQTLLLRRPDLVPEITNLVAGPA
jgi:hypothetical protein